MKEMSNLCAFMKHTFQKGSGGDLIDTGKRRMLNSFLRNYFYRIVNTFTPLILLLKGWHHCLLRL